MNDNKIDNDEYNELVKVYEEYKKNKNNILSVFFKLKLLLLSNNNVFGKNIISFNIYREAVTPIREPAWQIGKIKAIIETLVLVSAITKLSFLCT